MTDTVRSFDLPGIGTKSYRFPTHFEQVELFGVVARVSATAARAWVPESLSPVSLPGANALALFTVQRFGKPAELSPYDEATFAVFVRAPGGQRGFHVLTMPVTSRENLARGQVIFGLPKELAQISIGEEGNARRGEVSIDGAGLFSIRVRAALPIPLRVPVRLSNLQILRDERVSVRTRGDAQASLGLGSVTVGAAMERKFPGLSGRLSSLAGFRLTQGDLRLHLPEVI